MFDLNLIVVISLATLAFFSFCLFVVTIPIVLQLTRALSSAQHLLDTINGNLEPAVKEIKESFGSVRQVATKGTTFLRSNIQQTGIFVFSSAFGVLEAIRNYLSSYRTSVNSYNSSIETKKDLV